MYICKYIYIYIVALCANAAAHLQPLSTPPDLSSGIHHRCTALCVTAGTGTAV